MSCNHKINGWIRLCEFCGRDQRVIQFGIPWRPFRDVVRDGVQLLQGRERQAGSHCGLENVSILLSVDAARIVAHERDIRELLWMERGMFNPSAYGLPERIFGIPLYVNEAQPYRTCDFVGPTQIVTIEEMQ